MAELRAAVEASVAGTGSTLIEVPSDRAENVRLHARLWDAVGRAIAPGRG
jgi:2-succinyl-5-enolpyruvyl-6-hydroxy-3-cyclohexene-1-carboxylate synthase